MPEEAIEILNVEKAAIRDGADGGCHAARILRQLDAKIEHQGIGLQIGNEELQSDDGLPRAGGNGIPILRCQYGVACGDEDEGYGDTCEGE